MFNRCWVFNPITKRKPPFAISTNRTKQTLTFKTLNGEIKVDCEIITEVPKECNDNNFMCCKLTNFKNKPFDGLIGQNVLKILNANINIGTEYIEISNNRIKFCNSCLHEYDTLESSGIDEKIRTLLKDNLNKRKVRY